MQVEHNEQTICSRYRYRRISSHIIRCAIVWILEQEQSQTGYCRAVGVDTRIRILGTLYTRDSLSQHRPTVFVWFHTDCDFCRNEVKDIVAHLSDFADTQLLFVSTEPAETIRAFAVSSGLSAHPSVVLLEDRQMIFPVRFDVTTTPYTLVYGRNGRLLKRFHGQILSSAILKTLQTDDETQ